jgi:hypothetical protein
MSGRRRVLRQSATALAAPSNGARPIDLLRDHLALHYEGVLTRRECVAFARGVYAGRAAWVPNFDGVQFTLGRAWYVHLETDREDEYFDNVEAADADVERWVPGLSDRVLALASLSVGAGVRRREGYCGPGVHVFPAGEHVSLHGGDVHWDLEGLTDEQVAQHADAVSLVLMLQPAARGGGLRLWDQRYEGEESEEAAGSSESEEVVYGAGDLVVFDSYRLHQIQASSGPLDRISATCHAVRTDAGWEAWF